MPAVLTSGHHARISEWRMLRSLQRTLQRRPDLLERRPLAEDEIALLQRLARRRGHSQ